MVAIAKTFLDTHNIDLVTEYQIQGFKFFNKDRISRRGGGVATYIREYLNPTHHETPADATTEHISININTGSTTLNFNVVYRKPGQTVEEDIKLYNSLSTAINNKESVIVGDFNLPNINWTNNVGIESESHRLLDFIEDNFLHQSVTEPTRD